MSCESTLSQCQNYVVRTNGGGCHHCNALCTYAESVLGILCRVSVRTTMLYEPARVSYYIYVSYIHLMSEQLCCVNLCRIGVRITLTYNLC